MQAKIQSVLDAAYAWYQAHLTGWQTIAELSVVVVALMVGYFVASWLRRKIDQLSEAHKTLAKMRRGLSQPVMMAAFALLIIWTAHLAVAPYFDNLYVLEVASSLLTAWFFIRLLAGLIANRQIARMVSPIIWFLAALNILGFLDPLLNVLDNAKIPLGEGSLSALDIISGVFSLGLFFWIALFIAGVIEKQLRAIDGLPASARVLITKASRIILMVLAFLLALNTTGIDLTALAVFGGALGVGIGFGLQKVVGNFISGLILLMDRSIKPGDVVETGGTYGIINKLAARYTSVITRDGTEFLIPNEDMITQPVINWSHTDNYVRRRIPVLISYKDDPRRAMELMVEAALSEPRVLNSMGKEPQGRLMDFGENGISLELRFWISDAYGGVNNVASNIRLLIWDKFHDEGIEFPYPQRVVHLEDSQNKILK